MNKNRVAYLALIGRDESGKPYATDQMGFPGKASELKEIIEICTEILASKTEDLLDQEHEDFFKKEYPGMYAQSLLCEETERSKQRKKDEALILAKNGGRADLMSAGNFKKPGFIYVVFNPDTGLYKIGLSCNVNRRIKAISNQQGSSVELIHSFPAENMSKSERLLHEKFIHRHVHGEWFRLEVSDIEEIKSVGGAA